MRLDICLVEHLGVASRQKAQSLIMRGDVMLETRVLTKPGLNIKEQDIPKIYIKKQDLYVGFGAYKLLRAVEIFSPNLQDQIVLDIGASTGGFTQVALQQGARYVYAVDVGENQLDYTLRTNPQVISYEKTNARYLEPSYFTQGQPTFFTVDVSFISLSLIFPVLQKLNIPEGIILIKPQFEIGKEIKKFQGYVRSLQDIQLAIDRVVGYAADSGFSITKTTPSPEQHAGKNQEYLAWVKKTATPA